MPTALPISVPRIMQASKVDWDLVDEELDKVPEEFKDPRFDSLRHVLDILSAVDAEAALEEVRPILIPHSLAWGYQACRAGEAESPLICNTYSPHCCS